MLMRIYLLSRKCWIKRFYFLSRVLHLLIRICFSAAIPPSCDIDPSVKFYHSGLGVVLHSSTVIGQKTVIFQNVTIGASWRDENGDNGKAAKIGKNVIIGAGACILGEIYIGDNVKIGANSVVLDDIPKCCTAVGVPAKII